jgi:hypothetical protein
VTNIVTKSAVLTAACAGTVRDTAALMLGAEGFAPVFRTTAPRAYMFGMPMHGRSPLMASPQVHLLQDQQLRNEQGWSVASGTSPIAPTAYPAAAKGRRVSGPYPWRQPA